MAYKLDSNTYDTIGDFMEAYFERSAVRLLQHHATKPAFFCNALSESSSEIELAVQSGMRLPALILDEFEDILHDQNGSHTQRISSAISIIDTYQPGDARNIRQVRRRCRALAHKLIMQMKRDGLRGEPFQGVLIQNNIFLEKENLPGMYLGTVGGLFTGWTYEFTWVLPDNLLDGLEELS